MIMIFLKWFTAVILFLLMTMVIFDDSDPRVGPLGRAVGVTIMLLMLLYVIFS